jgi:hypothetical protein
MSMRFHPNKRASTDQAPGPSSARAAPMIPTRRLVRGSPEWEKAFQSSKNTTIAPATGVHKPASRSIAAIAESESIVVGRIGGLPRSIRSALAISATPAAKRRRSKPTPGQPWANVEYTRLKAALAPQAASPAIRWAQACAPRGGLKSHTSVDAGTKISIAH